LRFALNYHSPAGHRQSCASLTGLRCDLELRNTFAVESSVQILDALPVAALLADRAGNIYFANRLARETFSVDPTGQGVAMYLRSPAIAQALRNAVARGEAANVSYTQHGTTERVYEVHIAPLAGDDGQGAGVLITFWDKTREQQVERMRSDFVANASHELRTPLATLSGFIETMRGSAKDDSVARGKFLPVMKTQAERMSRLIDDLLSLGRIEISEHVVPAGRADLADATRQACGLLEPMAREFGCELSVDLPKQLPVTGDLAELVQAVHNLVENALKYGGDGKRVEVSGRAEGGKAIVAIRDFGPGIAAHHIPRLTERFYRVSVQDSRTRGGTGLGLAIVKHIVNRHRGKLSITSELGHGSCFSVAIPLRKTK
jgi:two-component system, OmpR family, phosphate regulon sensor histidine kinase PhoR